MLSVGFVGPAWVAVDETQLAGARQQDQDLVSSCSSRRLAEREWAPEGRFGGGDAGFFDESAPEIQSVVVGASTSQVQSDECRAILAPGRFLLFAP